jgi:ABC-2 type transport system ATP-binding protein
MLSCKNLSKKFDTDLFKEPFVALDNVSFDIEEGSIIGFLGANGAGKTTTIKIILDFIRASSGKVLFSEKLGKSNREIFNNIGYLPERPFFYPHLTGLEFTYYMGELSNMSKSAIKKEVERLAPIFKIDFALNRKINTYSKGMLQRIGFLCTLLHDPKLIILDEPLSGLDPIGRKDLKKVITEVNSLGKTVFFSSHIISDVEEICDQVIFLKDGKVNFQGSVDKLIIENIKPRVQITYKDTDVVHKTISQDEKAAFLKNLLEENKEIISISPEKPTLEEIFYKV